MTPKTRLTIITGNGKGKTTQALGRAVAAAWSGERVLIVQFLKGTGFTGELTSVQHWGGRIEMRQFGAGCPHSTAIRDGLAPCRSCGVCFQENKNPARDFVGQAFAAAKQAAASGEWDLLVLDEVSHAVNKGFLDGTRVIEWVRQVSGQIRLILTGRNMPAEWVALADEATECLAVKHPIQQGIKARWGVEY